MKTLVCVLLASGVALAGCAIHAPAELVHARLTYQRASSGPASTLVPAELHKAKEALALAESSFKKDGDEFRTRDLAYVATRKSEMANALAATAEEKASKAQADAAFAATQTQVVAKTKQELSTARENLQASELGGAQSRRELAQAEKKGDSAREALAKSEKAGGEALGALSAERIARISAEKLAADALAALAKLGEVKEETRGLVLTLSGSVLFASDKSALLPMAQTRLDQVVEALLSSRDRNLVVEGHTDSRGTRSHNLDLSQRRADAVRDYLLSKGYVPARIVAVGIGEERPISSNKTAEGRANNRRVEIVVQRVIAAMR